MRLLSTLPLLLLALCALTACDALAPKDPPPKEEPASNLPPAKIDLPPVPADLGQHATPEKNPDGSLTVSGLLRNRRKYLSKSVSVRGFITTVYDCPYDEEGKLKKPKKTRKKPSRSKDKPADEAKKMCERPHFTIADKAGERDKTLLIVDLSPWNEGLFKEEAGKKDTPKLKVGDAHTFTGTFTETANGFTASDYGLLSLQVIKDHEEPIEEEPKK